MTQAYEDYLDVGDEPRLVPVIDGEDDEDNDEADDDCDANVTDEENMVGVSKKLMNAALCEATAQTKGTTPWQCEADSLMHSRRCNQHRSLRGRLLPCSSAVSQAEA